MNIIKKYKENKQLKEIIQFQEREKENWAFHVANLAAWVVEGIKKKGISTVPEILLGHNQYPELNSELDKKYKEVQAKLVIKGFAIKGDNRLNGYSELLLTDYAHTIHNHFEYLKIFSPDNFISRKKNTPKLLNLIKENIIVQIITALFALAVIYLAYRLGWKI
ncbi:MAG: hypothetical protein ABI549_08655 [Flavobacterium sp.]|uniref:hypothetical protein n=1 Tax=Flavobacterium sp. TaxID=239 RepID=UPI003267A9B7